MPDPATPASVLYRYWAYADPPRMEYLSAGAEAMLEASAPEVVRLLATRRVPLIDTDVEAFYAGFAVSNRDHTAWQTEFGYVGPRSGRVRRLQAADFPQTAADGSRYFLGTLVDVTARWQAVQAERESADRLAAHMANTPLAVIEWQAGDRVSRWTGSAEALFGWAADEVLGKTVGEFALVDPADADRVAAAGRRLRTGDERRNVVFNRNCHKSGRRLACEWHNSALFDPNGAVRSVLSLVLDRTPAADAQVAVARGEVRLRDALHFAQMLGWEHDPVAGTVSHSTDRAAFYGGEDEGDPTLSVVHPADRERFWAAVTTAGRAGRPLAVEYRGVARSPDGRPRWYMDRGQVDADAAGRPVRMVGVTADVTDRVHAAEYHAGLDRQLLDARRHTCPTPDTHELTNALTVALANIQSAAGLLTDHPAAEPVWAAAAACGRMAATLRPATTPPPPTGWRGGGRALVADDEPNIRELVAALLEEVGFDVTRVASGPAALAAFQADPGAYRLAVTDILMPGIEGDALVNRLRADRPGLPAILMTGFVTRPIDPRVLNAPATRLLIKPFRVEHLLAAAQAVCGPTVSTPPA